MRGETGGAGGGIVGARPQHVDQMRVGGVAERAAGHQKHMRVPDGDDAQPVDLNRQGVQGRRRHPVPAFAIGGMHPVLNQRAVVLKPHRARIHRRGQAVQVDVARPCADAVGHGDVAREPLGLHQIGQHGRGQVGQTGRSVRVGAVQRHADVGIDPVAL